MKQIPQHTIDFIDSWLELRSKWSGVPGFVVAIAKDDKLLLNKGYGIANVETKEPMTSEHVFRIASHSKIFTATAIMKLQEMGKLRIDDPVVNYVSWLAEHSDKRWQEVTIRQLLSHSAGVLRDGLDAEFWKMRRPFPDANEMKQQIMTSELVIDPNTKMKYSNLGFALLGAVIESATEQSYQQAMDELIVQPLDLTNTRSELDELQKMAAGHSRESIDHRRKPFEQVTTNAYAPATGFSSTTEDLCRYLDAHLVGSDKLLSDESKREMQRLHWEIDDEYNETYGLGLVRQKIGDRNTIGHSGGFPGFITCSSIDVDDKTCVVVLTNAWQGMAGTIMEAIYAIIDEFGDEAPDDSLLRYEGRFDQLWSITQIYANSSGLRQCWLNSWYPLSMVTQYERVDDSTFRVSKASGYENYGETLTYAFADNGSIEHVVVGGSRLYPTIDGDIE